MSSATHFLQLSGIHPQLPKQEIFAILDGKKTSYEITADLKQCLVLECSEESIVYAASRSSYCRRAVSLFYRGKYDKQHLEEITQEISQNIDFQKHLEKNNTYRVRVYYTSDIDIKSITLENLIGKEIWKQFNGKIKADMKNPAKTFVVFFTEEEFFFGEEIYAQKRGQFKDRRADLRPFFKPGTLEPRFARLLVNLSQANEDRIFLDPFCGPGGILIEAALLNCPVIGFDVDKKMVYGAKKNLAFYAPNAYTELFLADARNIPFVGSIDSIATDPPYGKSSSTHGRKIKKLLDQFFEQAAQSLRKNGCLAIGMLEEIPLKVVADNHNFEVKVMEKIYIHKSLTRSVGVFLKK
jgi:tRNA (guanine10-N2)-dimethyltransferase